MIDPRVIERLRASKKDAEKKSYKAGMVAGREWASTTASYEELRRLKAGRDQLFKMDEKDGDAKRLVSQLLPESEFLDGIGDGRVQRFWSRALGTNFEELIASPHFVKGFAEGAVAIWDGAAPAWKGEEQTEEYSGWRLPPEGKTDAELRRVYRKVFDPRILADPELLEELGLKSLFNGEDEAEELDR